MTALTIIAAFLALTFYIYFVTEVAFRFSEVADNIWYGSGPLVDTLVGVTLIVTPFAMLIEVAT